MTPSWEFIRPVMQCKHHPLMPFSPPAEAVYRGVALGARHERFRRWMRTSASVHSKKKNIYKYIAHAIVKTKIIIIKKKNYRRSKIAKVALNYLNKKIYKSKNILKKTAKTNQTFLLRYY